jgi:hypothetical protein
MHREREIILRHLKDPQAFLGSDFHAFDLLLKEVGHDFIGLLFMQLAEKRDLGATGEDDGDEHQQ